MSCASVEIYFNFVQVRPTLVSPKAGKGIVIHKTCSLFVLVFIISQKQYIAKFTQVVDDVSEYHISRESFACIKVRPKMNKKNKLVLSILFGFLIPVSASYAAVPPDKTIISWITNLQDSNANPPKPFRLTRLKQ